MSIKITRPRDFWSGVMFLALGTGFAWGARGYGFGDSTEPGPGYFPFGLGVLLAALGAAGAVRALRFARPDPTPFGGFAWRPLLMICAAIALFGFTLPRFGLVVALPLAVVVAALGGDEFRWREALLNALVLTLGCWAVFVWGLQLALPLWPAAVRFGG